MATDYMRSTGMLHSMCTLACRCCHGISLTILHKPPLPGKASKLSSLSVLGFRLTLLLPVHAGAHALSAAGASAAGQRPVCCDHHAAAVADACGRPQPVSSHVAAGGLRPPTPDCSDCTHSDETPPGAPFGLCCKCRCRRPSQKPHDSVQSPVPSLLAEVTGPHTTLVALVYCWMLGSRRLNDGPWLQIMWLLS